MDFADVSLASLRAFREVAERGTFTSAGAALGYTQSGVSRQIATLERVSGTRLLERRRDGVLLTAAGRLLLHRAATVLDQIDAIARELAGRPDDGGTVRLGWFSSAGGALLPRALVALRRTHPTITVITREGSTPALVRAIRARSLDLALLGSVPPFRPPDAESPALKLETLAERSLCLAVSDTHPLARGDFINVADLRGQRWIASASSGDEQLMGVWPGLDERPEIAHTARDWLAKLHLVAAGCGITTVSPSLTPAIPPGVRVLPVHGGSQERRRILLARLPGPLPEPAAHLADALRATASRTSTAAQPQ
jgi:DNA-binding transcriptional LysR family regulator